MKIKKQLNKLKYYAYELHRNSQIPSDLFVLICKFDENTSEEEIRFLRDITEGSMRVKGYYKRNQEEHEKMNQEILKAYKTYVDSKK